MILLLLLFPLFAQATGGFEKSTLWSARSAQRGGAYASSVEGAEALLFNPASLRGAQEKELSFGVGAASGTVEAPVISNQEVKSFSGPVTPVGILYSQNISSQEAVGAGLYSIGGLSMGYDDIHLSSLGGEFGDFRPDIYGRLSVIELGVGYSRKLGPNFSVGGTLRNHLASGGFSQVQVTEARGLSGMGIPDGTVLAVSNGEFEEISGTSLGAYTLGLNYLSTDKDFGISVVYRSKVGFALKGKGSGKIAYSNTGAAASGANAGEIYRLSGGQSTITSALPEAWTVSLHKQIGKSNRFHFEYSWAEYSANKTIGINGDLRNPVDGSSVSVPDVNLRWHDLNEFKFGWTNVSIENWIIGGGYGLSTPVTNRKASGPTFATPANFHNLYLGLGKQFESFRVDAAYENYFSSGKAKTENIVSGNQSTPSVKGSYSSRNYSFIASISYFL